MVVCAALLRDATASCISGDNSPHAELTGRSSLPSGSALIVTWEPRGLANPLAASNAKAEENLDSWKLASGTTTIEVAKTGIAPGLFVVAPKTAVTGKVTVTDPAGETHEITFTSDALPSALPAPRVTAIKRRTTKASRMQNATAKATAKLRGEPPDDAYALIAYVGNQPVAWGSASAWDEGGIQIFHDDTPCWAEPNDAAAPRAGTKVQLAWLDRYGRLSKRSAAIAIK